MIYLGCHSDNFGYLSGDDTFSFIRFLGFKHIDVSTRSFISQEKIYEDPKKQAVFICDLAEKYEIHLDELFLGEVELNGCQINLRPDNETEKNCFLDRFKEICLFASLAGFKSVMAAPGTENPVFGYEKSFENAINMHSELIKIANDNGISYHVEPSRNSLLNSPQKALEMIQAVPLLRYTMDFLHFQINSVPLEESMKLLPFAGHMHARQARAGTGKCSYEQGELNFDIIVKRMHELNWQGSICMEFWNGPEENAKGINPVDQNILMRFELKQLIKKYYGFIPE